jgi:TonB-dependent starch-binding outer membrane protein SusC
MKGKGIDIVLNSKIVGRAIKWNAILLFNYNTSRTSEYYTNDANVVSRLLSGGNTITPIIGKPLYSIAAYKWGGLDASGNPQGYENGQLSINYTGIINEGRTKGETGNIVFIGSTIPEFFGSLNNILSWKNIVVSANFAYKFGYYFQRTSIGYSQLINSGNGHKDFEKRWQKPGDEIITNVPSFIYPNNSQRNSFYENSEILVEKGDHIRLQYINFSYSIFKKKVEKIHLNEIQLYINAANLGILWRANKEKLDPEYPSTIPPTKSIAFGVRVSL